MYGYGPYALRGGFPVATGFGYTNTIGGYSHRNFGTPQLNGFGFPPPYAPPSMFFKPAASSFDINYWLGAAGGIAVPINVGPTPPNYGLPPFLSGGFYRF
jgi:hypothetical protein